MEENYIVVGENKDNVNSKVLNCNSFSEFIYDEINSQGDNVYVVSNLLEYYLDNLCLNVNDSGIKY